MGGERPGVLQADQNERDPPDQSFNMADLRVALEATKRDNTTLQVHVHSLRVRDTLYIANMNGLFQEMAALNSSIALVRCGTKRPTATNSEDLIDEGRDGIGLTCSPPANLAEQNSTTRPPKRSRKRKRAEAGNDTTQGSAELRAPIKVSGAMPSYDPKSTARMDASPKIASSTLSGSPEIVDLAQALCHGEDRPLTLGNLAELALYGDSREDELLRTLIRHELRESRPDVEIMKHTKGFQDLMTVLRYVERTPQQFGPLKDHVYRVLDWNRAPRLEDNLDDDAWKKRMEIHVVLLQFRAEMHNCVMHFVNDLDLAREIFAVFGPDSKRSNLQEALKACHEALRKRRVWIGQLERLMASEFRWPVDNIV